MKSIDFYNPELFRFGTGSCADEGGAINLLDNPTEGSSPPLNLVLDERYSHSFKSFKISDLSPF